VEVGVEVEVKVEVEVNVEVKVDVDVDVNMARDDMRPGGSDVKERCEMWEEGTMREVR
jgi:hypothetical protein